MPEWIVNNNGKSKHAMNTINIGNHTLFSTHLLYEFDQLSEIRNMIPTIFIISVYHFEVISLKAYIH